MVEIGGIKLVPLRVPLKRRLQSSVVLFVVSLYFVLPFIASLLMIYVTLFTSYYLVPVTYVAWIFYDVRVLQTSSRGGRRWLWFRHHSAWNYLRDYFPVSLHKTSDLDTNKNYIFCYHPHGIFGIGACSNFATDATGFSKLFPGITVYLMTLKPNFSLPILREILLWIGVCDVSKQSIQWVVRKTQKAKAAVILVGGAEESLEAKPGNYNLKLLQRKGFVKQALISGASLVPIFSFGENDLFVQAENPTGSGLRNFQQKFKSFFGFAPPIFHGRGVLNYSFGIMPYRKPIHTVVGPAIDVPQIDDPSTEVINKYHDLYIKELINLFETNKSKYNIAEDVKLNII